MVWGQYEHGEVWRVRVCVCPWWEEECSSLWGCEAAGNLHVSWKCSSLCDTRLGRERAHTVYSGLKVRGAWGICVSNSIASGWMIGQMKGLQRDVSRAEQSNSSRQEATCICTHCCGQYWPNTSTVCGFDPPKPKPNQIQLVPKPSWIPMKLINPRWHIFWCKNLLKLKSELQINRQHRFIAKWGISWRRIAGLLDCWIPWCRLPDCQYALHGIG